MANLSPTRKLNITLTFVLYVCFQSSAQAFQDTEYLTLNSGRSEDTYYTINLLDNHRYKRDVQTDLNVTKIDQPQQPDTNKSTVVTNITNAVPQQVNKENVTDAPLLANVTDKPLLGFNGTGIRKDIAPKLPKVSDPIKPDDDDGLNMTVMFNETPDLIKAEHNLSNIKYDNHTFYNSSFIKNLTYFQQYWDSLMKTKGNIHKILSNSHRRATTLRLSFDFPFYGHLLRNITVATGGFIYMGDHVHNWLAATQYIAPLMANFDTRLSNESFVKLYDDGTQFIALWENVTLQGNMSDPFTFAVTLMKNGDIIFSYKDIPIPIKNINEKDHPVKVGISDAYLTDKVLFYVRRKTIYEYHRATFLKYEITNSTILKLTALPTCLQYDSCESCINHQTTFNCTWCSQVQRCSSGIDRHKQDWIVRNCDKLVVRNITDCPASPNKAVNNDTTTYVIDNRNNPFHDTVINSAVDTPVVPKQLNVVVPKAAPAVAAESKVTKETSSSSMGGVVVGLITVVLISSLAIWVTYAFKNPHTRSGQLLIKYRPSQWSWRRGEARYTAATIHM